MATVTLLTDYGLLDTYVGQVKGAILRVAPSAQLVDLTHQVPAQDVRAGAFLLWTAVEAFAPRTIHLAVVDPGVGTTRRAVAIRSARGDLLVGPDNGLLVPAAEKLGGVTEAVALTREQFHGPARSTTFHGRDVFGPVAGHLASGAALASLGGPAPDLDRSIAFPAPVRTASGWRGEVLHVDGFGNLITNLPAAILPERFSVRVGPTTLAAPHPHFQSVARGELWALVGSAGLLEVGVRDGDAAARLGVATGAAIEVERAG